MRKWQPGTGFSLPAPCSSWIFLLVHPDRNAYKLLLDECVAKRLKRDPVGHDVWTVGEMGWASKRNGEPEADESIF
jgi:hypothetical protein